jgi:transposase
VSQWLKRARNGGREASRRRAAPGATPELTAAQRERLPEKLARGAEADGFVGEVWTTKRAARLIEEAFGVQYHPAHVSRLLRQIGWTVQQPVRRATQRDEAAVATWRDHAWPALRAKPATSSARSSS